MKCPNCKKEDDSFSEKYDAESCSKCNIWVSQDCGAKTCEYCKDRPLKPFNDAITRKGE